jgi:hypothetical protein
MRTITTPLAASELLYSSGGRDTRQYEKRRGNGQSVRVAKKENGPADGAKKILEHHFTTSENVSAFKL